jgi:predicted glycogen debranching enzyme
LVTPQPAIDNELHVLLSTLDPTIIQHDAAFNLGIHRYPNGVYSPRGHKYVRELDLEPSPSITYRVGGVVLKVEALFSSDADRIMLRYSLLDCHSPTLIQLKPYLAFRSRHELSKANEFANTKFETAENGVSFKMYQGYTPLYIQSNLAMEYIHSPNWYFNIEYLEEQKRGFDFQEDLMVPGYFEFELKKGQSIIVAAGTTEASVKTLTRNFNGELKKRTSRDSFKNCLKNSAEQFIEKRNNKTQIVAGFPWYGRWGRDTFVSLPGLTLALGKTAIFKEVINSMLSEMSGPLFPNLGTKNTTSYNSVDAPLWFFWAMQQYEKYGGSRTEIWKNWGPQLKSILRNYRSGTQFNIIMEDNGLIYSGEVGKALTWMDAISAGKPVTPRIGYAVEINALGYNALCYMLELAKEFKDMDFVNEFQSIADGFPKVFMNTFWNDKYAYLADYVNGDYKDWAIRPNMIFAVSLPYSPLSKEYMKAVLHIVERELLTVRGLRTLSPNHSEYEGVYEGNQIQRDKQYHQGTVWPWLMGAFVDAYLKVNGRSGLRKMQWHIEQFEDVMNEHGIGSISEIYDGNPPHQARGAISQAWSVGEIIRAMDVIDGFEAKEGRAVK